MRNHSSRACFRSALPGKSGPWLVSWFLLSALFLSHLLGASASEDSKVDFQRQIRPLLSNACFQYHGPDAKTRVAGLRLDLREALFQSQASGVPIAPGEPEAQPDLSANHASGCDSPHASGILSQRIERQTDRPGSPLDQNRVLFGSSIGLLFRCSGRRCPG